MKISCFTRHGPLNSKPIFGDLLKSMQDAGDTVLINKDDNCDVAVIWSVLWQGRMRNYKRIWDQYRNSLEWLIYIHDVWKANKSTQYLDFIVNRDDERFKDFDKHAMLISSLASGVQPKNAEKLNSIDWDLVIVDEAHRLKNESTRSHQFVKELPKKFVFLLSATPIQNSIKELFNMVEIVNPGILGPWKTFAGTYTIDKKARIINPSNKHQLQSLLSQSVIRTTREEVKQYISFTDRIPKTHRLDGTTDETELYNLATDFVRKLWHIEQGGRNFILPLMTLQRQISSSTESLRVALLKKMKKFPD